jgi:hypothetical protein
MQLVSTVTLGSAATSISFTGVPQSGTDLLILFSARTTEDANGFLVDINGDTASNYTSRILGGNGSSVFSSSSTDVALLGFSTVPSSATANTFSNGSIYFPNYTSSTAKTGSTDSVTENNGTVSTQLIAALRWAGTAAITTVRLWQPAGRTFVQNTSASLYIITKA